METENKGKKTAAKIFLTFSIILCLTALLASWYIGGQQKIINSCYTAVMRDENSPQSKALTDGSISPELAERLKNEYRGIESTLGADEDAIIHMRINYKGRKMTSLTSCEYRCTMTYFDGDAHDVTTDEKCLSLVRDGLKWKINGIDQK